MKNERAIILLLLGGLFMLVMPVAHGFGDGVMYYPFDSNIADINGTSDLNGTNEGFVAGKVSNAVDFEFDNVQGITNLTLNGSEMARVKTIDCWFKPESLVDNMRLLEIGNATNGSNFLRYHKKFNGDQINIVLIKNGQTVIEADSHEPLVAGVWQHLILFLNSTGWNIHTDGSWRESIANTESFDAENFTEIYFGVRDNFETITRYDGLIDNCFFSDKAYNSSDVTDSYNSGNGRAFAIDVVIPSLNISLNDTSLVQNDGVNVSVNITDETGLSDCQIIINQTGSNQFFNFSLSGTSAQCSQNFTITPADGATINFTVRVNDTSDNKNQSSIIILTGDSTAPSLVNCTLQKSTLTDASGNTNNFTCSATDNGIVDVIRFDLNGTLTGTKTFVFADASPITTTYTLFGGAETLAEGSYSIMNVTVIDTSGNTLTNATGFHFTVTVVPVQTTSGGGGSQDVNVCSLELFRPKEGRSISMFAPAGQETQATEFVIKNNGVASGSYTFFVKDNIYLEDNCNIASNDISIEPGLEFVNTITCTTNNDVEEGNIEIAGCGQKKNYKLQVSSSRFLAFFGQLVQGKFPLFGISVPIYVVVLFGAFVVLPLGIVGVGGLFRWAKA